MFSTSNTKYWLIGNDKDGLDVYLIRCYETETETEKKCMPRRVLQA